MNIFSPGFREDEAAWTIEAAGRIAERLLPSDVEVLREPHPMGSYLTTPRT